MENNTSTEVAAEAVEQATQEVAAEAGQEQHTEMSTQEALEAIANAAEENVEAKTEEVEAKVEEKKQEEVKPEQDSKFAAKFAALSRREKALRLKEKELETRMAELEKKLTPKEEPKVEIESLEQRLKKDPFAALKDLGYDAETLIAIAQNQGRLTPELQMKLIKEELEKGYKAEIEQVKKSLQDKEEKERAAREQQAIADFQKGIASHISSNTAEYELLNAEGQDGADAVFEVINQNFNETGEIMSVKEAADAVENYLLEEAKKRLELGKLKKLVTPQQQETAKVAQNAQKTTTEQGQAKRPVTLSNQQTQVVPKKGSGLLSREESLEQVAKLIKWVE